MDKLEIEEFFIQHKLPFYALHRERIKSGDLLQWRSETNIGASIRFFRKLYMFIKGLFYGKWKWPYIRDNHSSWVIRGPYQTVEERRWHCEALAKGLELNKISDRLCSHKGKAWWHKLKPEYDDKRECVSRWAYNHLNTGYDFLSIFRQIYRHVKIGTSRLFCSEAVCAACRDCSLTDNEEAKAPDEILSLGLWENKGVRIK